MTPKKQMTEAVKSCILTLYEENISVREIARRVGYAESTVRKFLKNFADRGSFERKQGSGRKRKTTARDDRDLKFEILKNRFVSAAELKRELKDSNYGNVSVRTIERRLNELGFMSRRPAKKPFLNEKMRKNRLLWAQNYQTWFFNEWSRVIFSDESKFNLFGQDGKENVRRRKGERLNPQCVSSTVKHSAYIMVWGCITAHGVGPIKVVEGIMNAEKYKNVISDDVVSVIEDLSQYTDTPIYQDDSAPCHRAKSVTDLKEHLGINSLPWPGNSPDLNPIENFWAFIGKKLRENKPKTIQELKSAISRIWYDEIPSEIIISLYQSMPRRIESVLKAKGGSTKY